VSSPYILNLVIIYAILRDVFLGKGIIHWHELFTAKNKVMKVKAISQCDVPFLFGVAES